MMSKTVRDHLAHALRIAKNVVLLPVKLPSTPVVAMASIVCYPVIWFEGTLLACLLDEPKLAEPPSIKAICKVWIWPPTC